MEKLSYLNYAFEDSEETVNTFDEMPLWSAAFGLLMLKHLQVAPNLRVVDIGSGTGFPLLELAGRFGDSCKFYGVDIWKNANSRAQQKIKNYQLRNVEIIETSADKMPFETSSIDLIVSNLGINNFEEPHKVFSECNIVLKTKGKLVLTTNLNGHWKEFYHIFENVVAQLNAAEVIEKLDQHQKHRGNVESLTALFERGGFAVTRFFEESFEMNFADGTAFLNHHFVKLGWMESWKALLPYDKIESVFFELEKQLNQFANQHNGLKLSVPMLFMEGQKK